MEYKNVLVLTDFSKDSDEAVKAAVDFTKKYNPHLIILNVVPDTYNLTYVLSDSEYHTLERKLEKHANEQFEKMEAAPTELAEIGTNAKYEREPPISAAFMRLKTATMIWCLSPGDSHLNGCFRSGR
jgi:nucleotide-binding universal stress UspA family protein